MYEDIREYQHEVCSMCCKTANKWAEKPFEKEMILDYRMCIDKVMRAFFGIQIQEVIDRFIDTCGFGNWEKFWVTEDEEIDKTIDEWADDLWAEVFYCSDRWDWDRLIRTNWIFQRMNQLYKNHYKTYKEWKEDT